MTCATPGIVSSRCRTTQSASVRTSIGGVVPSWLYMPTIMICPMIDEIGANSGLTDSGSRSRTMAIRSLTICRAM